MLSQQSCVPAGVASTVVRLHVLVGMVCDDGRLNPVHSSTRLARILQVAMCGSRKFCQRGPNFETFFLMRGGRIQIPL